jgi:glycosyltransferase involved in cell wall biosynthesis
MIVIIHRNNKVIHVIDYYSKEEISTISNKPIEVLFQLAKAYNQHLIAWCHDDLKAFINEAGFKKIFHHKLVMASYEIRKSNYISEKIGYVESSPYINIKKEVTYPTWLMSSCIGAINAEALIKFDFSAFKNDTFDYALNSIAKKGIVNGLFCYSSPSLLSSNKVTFKAYKSTIKTLFKFIKQHYKSRWTFITFFNSLIYEKKLLLLPLIVSLTVSKKQINPNFKNITIKSTRSNHNASTLDVVIPTIGRKPYLYNVLLDLSKQTLLPKQVIIVEQNPISDSQSELDYLTTHSWPFKIKHVFIHQTGACYARNIALTKVESDFVFLADDDIRFEKYILREALSYMKDYTLAAATLSCLKKGEKETINNMMSWHTFGSGCSIVKTSILKNISYDLAFEHGFGEDGDFGMQIRNLGADIGYLPHCNLLHLKAPIGGFRTKFEHPWEKEKIQPKPSPTIMLFNIKHKTQKQLLGYKTILFLKFFKLQSNKNVISYISIMKKRWNKSIYWAQQLNNTHQKINKE